MLKRFSVRYAFFSIFLDVLCITGTFLLAMHLRRTLPYGLVPFSPQYPDGIPPVWFHIVIVVLWLGVAFAVSLYDPKKSYKFVDELQTLSITLGMFWLSAAGLLYFTYRQTSRLLVIYAVVGSAVTTLAWRMVMRAYFHARTRRRSETGPRNRVLILGAGQVGQQVAAMIDNYAWVGLELVGFLDDDHRKCQGSPYVLGTLDDVAEVVIRDQIQDVVLALPPAAHERVNEVVSMLHEFPVNVRIVPDYFSLALYRATVDDFGGIPMINLRDPALNDYQRLIKRAFDLVVVGAMTLALSPVMGVIALAIKLDSPGPIFFRQERVGENGRIFGMYKFRSMVENAEQLQVQMNGIDEDGNLIHKHKDDPRVTRVGRFIRRWSLDELPQLLNVLKGDMSLIGPRPELPWLVEKYEPWQRKRFAVPQGLTGWWQVNGRSDKMMHLHTDEDLYYIQNYSLWLDIYILLKTPWVVLRGKGAY